MSDKFKDQLKLSPRERSLLEELAEIKELSGRLVRVMADQNDTLDAQRRELNQLRRSLTALQEENSRLNRALQQWNQRAEQMIAQLRTPL